MTHLILVNMWRWQIYECFYSKDSHKDQCMGRTYTGKGLSPSFKINISKSSIKMYKVLNYLLSYPSILF